MGWTAPSKVASSDQELAAVEPSYTQYLLYATWHAHPMATGLSDSGFCVLVPRTLFLRHVVPYH